MTRDEPTDCPTCPMHANCHSQPPQVDAPDGEGLAGWRLVAAAAGYLLAPLAAAIAAAALTPGPVASVLAAGLACAVVAGAAAAVGALLRRKRSS